MKPSNENKQFSVDIILEKFDNGQELYNTNPLFRQIIYMLANNHSIYQALEFVVKAHDLQTKSLVEEMNKRPIDIIIKPDITSKEIEDFYNKGGYDLILQHYNEDGVQVINDEEVIKMLLDFIKFIIDKQIKNKKS